MGCLTLLVTANAHADPAPESVEPPPASCEGLPDRTHLARYEPVGEDGLYVVARSGERYLVFPHQEEVGCVVYPIGRAAAQVDGKFGSGIKAFVLKPPICNEQRCAVVLAVRGPGERPIAALHTEENCDYSATLRPIKLFPGRDSIELVCRTSAAGGWEERHMLVDVTGNTLVTLYSLDTGGYGAVSPNEWKAGHRCPTRPVGTLRVERTGEKPLLRVVDPAWGELQAGKGTLPARQLGYDPERHTFAPTGAPDVPTKVDAFAGCLRR